MHIVSSGNRQFVFDAPDFLENQVASAFCPGFFECLNHIILRLGYAATASDASTAHVACVSPSTNCR
jgi:hypothetical protein